MKPSRGQHFKKKQYQKHLEDTILLADLKSKEMNPPSPIPTDLSTETVLHGG